MMITLYKAKTRKRRPILKLGFVNHNKIKGIVLFLGVVGLGVLISLLSIPPSYPPILQEGQQILPAIEKTPISACFSPEGNCTERIVQAIHNAKSSIYVQAYSFTSLPIAQALIQAKKRGVDVNVILDKSQPTARGSQLSLLVNSNIPVAIDSIHGIAHNKIIIFDECTLLTGSFNFTNAADSRNAENLLFIQDEKLAHLYKDNWDKRALQSRPYEKAL